MDACTTIFEGDDLRGVLEEARQHVLRHGRRGASARGETFSVNGVKLVWRAPVSFQYWGWDQQATQFYYRIFVEKLPENAPERLAEPGELVFPYTYARRSRFWDGGWGAALAVTQATAELGEPVRAILESEASFCWYLARAGERVHLQTLLSVWDWLGAEWMAQELNNFSLTRSLLDRTRIDQLERIIQEIKLDPGSRRAVTASFIYPSLDQRLERLYGIPPYQFFQLLPGNPDEPLHSFHVHRSLDASDGVQLDFYHDYRWLGEACRQLNRPTGTISVTAGDFHVYMGAEGPLERESLEGWLSKVTDGYRAGEGRAGDLVSSALYRQNISAIYRRLCSSNNTDYVSEKGS